MVFHVLWMVTRGSRSGGIIWPRKANCSAARLNRLWIPPPVSVASFGGQQEFTEKASFRETLCGHFEQFVDEPILTLDAIPGQPPHLALPNYIHRLIALNRRYKREYETVWGLNGEIRVILMAL